MAKLDPSLPVMNMKTIPWPSSRLSMHPPEVYHHHRITIHYLPGHHLITINQQSHHPLIISLLIDRIYQRMFDMIVIYEHDLLIV